MTKHVYIIDYSEKEISGYKTFREELVIGLTCNPTLHVHVISLNEDVAHITKDETRLAEYIQVPSITGPDSHLRIIAALKLSLPDRPENIFLCNFTPAANLLSALSLFFKKSKKILVLHDIIAAYYLKGRLDKYDSIIGTQPMSEQTSQSAKEENISKFLQDLHREYCVAFENATKIICLCEDTHEFLRTSFNIPESKLVLINNGLRDAVIDSSELTKAKNTPSPIVKFIFVGRMTDNKGFNILLKAISKIIDSNCADNMEVICAGPISKQRLSAIDSRITSRVSVLGSINRKELYKLYQEVDAGIILSKYEQCSYAGIELKMFCLPIIALPSFGVRNMCTPDNSIVIDVPRDISEDMLVDKVAETLTDYLKNHKHYAMPYAEKSREDFEERYTFSQMINAYQKCFDDIFQQP